MASKPHIVSRGAQYCFSDFATYISELLEKNNLAITEKYFQDAVSKIILFRTIERMDLQIQIGTLACIELKQ